MQLFKTHFHTSERRGYEADQKRQEKKGKKGGLSVKDRKNVNESYRNINCKGGGRGCVDRNAKKKQVPPQPEREG